MIKHFQVIRLISFEISMPSRSTLIRLLVFLEPLTHSMAERSKENDNIVRSQLVTILCVMFRFSDVFYDKVMMKCSVSRLVPPYGLNINGEKETCSNSMTL